MKIIVLVVFLFSANHLALPAHSLAFEAARESRGGGDVWNVAKAVFRSLKLGSDPAKAFRACTPEVNSDLSQAKPRSLGLLSEKFEQKAWYDAWVFIEPALADPQFRETLATELNDARLGYAIDLMADPWEFMWGMYDNEFLTGPFMRAAEQSDFEELNSEPRWKQSDSSESWAKFKELLESFKADSPAGVSEALLTFLQSSEFLPKREILIGAVEVLSRLTTRISSSAFAGVNASIIQNNAELLASDSELLMQCYDFYERLKKADAEQPGLREPGPRFWEQTDFNLWALAQESTGSNAINSFRCIGVFGHDVIARTLDDYEKPIHPWVSSLNFLGPAPESFLHTPNSLPGLKMSKKILKRFDGYYQRYLHLKSKHPDLDLYDLEEGFRAGYYHAIGGVIVATEMIHAGFGHYYGFNLPVLLSELAGYFYKRMSFRTHMDEDTRLLYDQGYRNEWGKIISRPEGWSQGRFERAKLLVEMNLAHIDLSAEQHLRGAEWAYQKLKHWVKTPEFEEYCFVKEKPEQ